MICNSCKKKKETIYVKNLNQYFCKNCFREYVERIVKRKIREIGILKKYSDIVVVGISSCTLDTVYSIIQGIRRKKQNLTIRKVEYRYVEDILSLSIKDNFLLTLPIECIGILVFSYFFGIKMDYSIFNTKNLFCELSEYEASLYLQKKERKSFFRKNEIKLIEEFFIDLIDTYPKYLRSILTSFKQLISLNALDYENKQ